MAEGKFFFAVLCVLYSATSRNCPAGRGFSERGGAPNCTPLQAADHTKPATSRRSALAEAWPRHVSALHFFHFQFESFDWFAAQYFTP